MEPSLPLEGFTVAVTADRRSEEQKLMLTRLGIDVFHAPTIKTIPVGDDDRLRALTEEVIARPPDFLVANTGLGIRSWFGLASSWGLDQALRNALSSARIAARGPKAAGAIGIAGLDLWWRAKSERLATVGDRLAEEGVAGKRVALQLHGDGRQELTAQLQEQGAEVIEIPVYRWVVPEDDGPVQRLITLCSEGAIDAVTFTAAPAVRNLIEMAELTGRARQLLRALNGGILVACVGPVCSAAALDEGITDPVTPEHWRLGSLVRLVSEELAARRRQLGAVDGQLVLQGSVLRGAAIEAVRLSSRERVILACLAERPGAAVGRHVLMRRAWDERDVDPHALEAVIGRLRAKLGEHSGLIETVHRRGYRLSTAG
ncbi:uroporphyrinogen-III synthase [Acidiferrimicrobium sp. IK]|uniref:uroporphyrinogen-III synthase n=1 Tax=Acidiferrimicrobium sp. IK TaxID=2871700 RepID=UPI0021CB4275|nr:uroporphyrinogen-III synthase [Acidiferrimicrobium sp. IK]MCU4185268.1 uroporphyrinogen-III synthase [Acidiferrimicrobium sp. IK]